MHTNPTEKTPFLNGSMDIDLPERVAPDEKYKRENVISQSIRKAAIPGLLVIALVVSAVLYINGGSKSQITQNENVDKAALVESSEKIVQETNGQSDQDKAMCDLYWSTNIQLMHYRKWLSGWDCKTDNKANGLCSGVQWTGVTCSGSLVTKIDLASPEDIPQALSGSLPESLGLVTSLEHINMARNALGSTIPESFGSLSKLTYLQLSNGQIGGVIPDSFVKLTNLVKVNMALTKIGGSIPDDIGKLRKLQEFNFQQCKLQGVIPQSLGQLTKLRGISLSSNSLDGILPANLDKFYDLTSLNLGYNELEGYLPPHLGKLSKLVSITLNDNCFTGSLPAMNLPNLVQMRLSYNQFTGTFPSGIGNSKSVTYLMFQGNRIDGTVPSELAASPDLQQFALDSNDMWGSIPTSFCFHTYLYYISISWNQPGVSCKPWCLSPPWRKTSGDFTHLPTCGSNPNAGPAPTRLPRKAPTRKPTKRPVAEPTKRPVADPTPQPVA
eukprot:CAMPEP_0182437590 /NCGR_PEP_ID=MMETSP1167-20130531/85147_1 /TAXON_ID=2988 /ORGANISM="Mallomonas Sp, Strain CCMP3275" /LENGTH=496 /DNA_ID=CAMNT_0024630557 /DNA_START=459 /DNA_END=1945 /DNA_ORIENTATION=-